MVIARSAVVEVQIIGTFDFCPLYLNCSLKNVKMTLRDSTRYHCLGLIYDSTAHKRHMVAAYRRRGLACSKTYGGGRRLELARLSKLCGGGPHQAVSHSQADAAVYRVAITVWLGGRGTLSVISRRNVICVFTAQRGLSQACTLNPAT